MSAVAVEAPVRWREYAVGSEAEHFAWWCARYLVQSEDQFAGLPLVLEPFELEFMGEALATRDDDGSPFWLSCVLIVGRKNGKTALLAAYALYRLLTAEGKPEILLAAASDRQAKRLYEAVVAFVLKNPELSRQVHLRESIGEIARRDGGAKLLRMSHEPTTLHGYNPSLVICDELHAWSKPSHRGAWKALTTGGGARKKTQVFTITTAGTAQDRETGILGGMLDRNEERGEVDTPAPGLTVSRNLPGRTLIYNYCAATEDPFDLEAMQLANPASWITDEYLLREANNPELSEADVLQLHGCVWAAGADSWLPADVWRECAAEISVPDGSPVILAFDGSYNRDSTALVGCTLDETPHIFVVGVWERPDGARDDWIVDREHVKYVVDEAMKRFSVQELTCDPKGWDAEIKEWGEVYAGTMTAMYPANQRAVMTAACSKFYGAVLENGVTHDGNKRLAVHLANAVVQLGPNVKYITKEYPDSPRKIDLAVAAVMAFDRATQRRYDGPILEVLV